MQKLLWSRGALLLSCALFMALFLHLTSFVASANRYSSSSYIIDASVGNSFGGSTSSTSYNLTSSGGEAVIGNGSSGSYKMGEGYVAQLEKSIELNIVRSNLFRYWSMNENFGKVAYNNTYTTTGDAQLYNDPAWATGKIGSGLLFDGSNDYMEDPTTSQSQTALTVSAWVKLTNINKKQAVITHAKSIDGSPGDGWQLGVSASNRPYFKVCGTTTCTTVETTGGTMGTGTWYRIAGRVYADTQVPGTYKVHAVLNNDQSANGSSSEVLAYGSPRTFTVGAQPNFGGARTAFLDGTVDEVRIYGSNINNSGLEDEKTAQDAGVPGYVGATGVTPVASKTVDYTAVVKTDAPSYALAVSQDHDLQQGIYTIPAISGSIATPATWTEGSTVGLGFTILAGPSGVPVDWGSNPNYKYAAYPNSLTTFYTRSGYTAGAKDILDMQARVMSDYSHPRSDLYKNTATFSATTLP